jgi:YidC/Oxa1 family membrane protein insertase
VAGWLNNGLFSESADSSAKQLAKYTNFYSADWLGYMDQYFLTAFVLPDQEGRTSSLQEPSDLSLTSMVRDKGLVQVTQFWPLNLGPSLETDYKFDFYYGPKDSSDLTSVGRNLEKSVDLGWFTVLANPLTFLLKMFYGLVGNYGVAIIIVTILIKIALWPLTAKSYKSMKEMQKLQPRIMKLREKYKDDRENLNKEMMQLYKTYKVSPVGGCLPMVLQIPFFIAFYRVLDYSLELRGAPFFLWINDLSAPDRLFHFSFSLPLLDPPTGIPVLTLLMGVSMLWQQKMAPTMGDPMQAKIMMLMPIFFIFILLNMPSGLVLYWLVNNILSIFQQKLINRPTPPVKTLQGSVK